MRGLTEGKGWIKSSVFEWHDGTESIWTRKEEGSGEKVGSRGVFGANPGSEKMIGRLGGVRVDDVVVFSPFSAVGAGGTEGSLCHFDRSNDFRCIARVFESHTHRFAIPFVYDIATPVDEESLNIIFAQEVRNAVAEIALADRAKVEEGGMFERNMRVIEYLNGFDKIGGEADSVLWGE